MRGTEVEGDSGIICVWQSLLTKQIEGKEAFVLGSPRKMPFLVYQIRHRASGTERRVRMSLEGLWS